MFRAKTKTLFRYLLAGLVSFIFLSPFFWVLITSISKVLTQMPSFIMYFKNSIIISIISVIIVTLLAMMGGYALGRLEFRGKGLFLFFILLVISIPYAIYLIPIYIIESRLGLINTNLGLVLPYIALNLPLALYIMRGTFRTIPGELEEAAIIDGCNPWQLWYKVMVPVSKPGIATTIIFTFIMVWQEFVFAVTLMPDAKYQTLPVGIVHLRDEAQSWAYGTLSTTIVLALIPIFIIFLLMRNFFIKGLTEGAVKG